MGHKVMVEDLNIWTPSVLRVKEIERETPGVFGILFRHRYRVRNLDLVVYLAFSERYFEN